ncbi:3-isopropylmalate dehydratase small subunit [Ferrimonas balearica]|uniref:3-isopropylmalate dehydratase small subunit n=1 Tax=Ferrimonas balearica TaxID=44012 RepID=UPI001C99D9B0|nr:3-isopropylmalate dehydratase small subunit [Ferrimonas balearica]MBY5922706.1 3-isopropylmalate dehydratase small subunit [Ferrimonas balearica]MBY5995690.1 3-isopropylmalate dehydratase small subunit [Ferrimonas balearica]
MQAFTQHRGIAVALNHANIDTDQLIPKQFLAKVTREGFGVHLFHDWRYLDEAGEQPNPEFALNQQEYAGASILLAGENFGCGSSREHAPWALADFGFRAIIAPSFADIFYQNAINNGLLPVVLPEAQVQALMATVAEQPGCSLTVDLTRCVVEDSQGQSYPFTLDAAARQNLLEGKDAIGQTLAQIPAIEAFEASSPNWR